MVGLSVFIIGICIAFLLYEIQNYFDTVDAMLELKRSKIEKEEAEEYLKDFLNEKKNKNDEEFKEALKKMKK